MESPNNECHIKLEWDLSCSKATAKDLIAATLDMGIRPLIFGGGNIKGMSINDKIYFWEAFPSNRGIPFAVGVVKFNSIGDHSRLSATLKLPFLYRYAKPTTPKVAVVVILAVASWLLTLTGALFENYQILIGIFFPIGALSITTLLLFLSRSFGEEQLSNLLIFLEGTVGKYRQTANQEVVSDAAQDAAHTP